MTRRDFSEEVAVAGIAFGAALAARTVTIDSPGGEAR